MPCTAEAIPLEKDLQAPGDMPGGGGNSNRGISGPGPSWGSEGPVLPGDVRPGEGGPSVVIVDPGRGGGFDHPTWPEDRDPGEEIIIAPITSLPFQSFLNELKESEDADMYSWWMLDATPEMQTQISNFLHENNTTPPMWEFDQEDIDFVKEIIEIYRNVPGVTTGHIENWFLNKQTEFETNLDIDPDLITYDVPVQQVPLPSLTDFTNSFPKLGSPGNYYPMPSPDVYQLVGGSLWASHQNNPAAYSNACSIRGSRGLLYSGIQIPVLNYPGVGQRTQKGGDNKNYILDAVSFDKFMQDKFGAATYELTGTDANDPQQVATMLNGKNGIYVIINENPTQATYSGHVDAIIDGRCISNAYTTPAGGVKSIRIWELQ